MPFDIKLQAMIRKGKNGKKELLDKKKIITDYSHIITIPDILSTKNLIYPEEYSLNDILIKYPNDKSYNDKSYNDKLCIINISAEEAFSLYSASPFEKCIFEPCEQEYINNKYFKNIYNAECYDSDWLIMVYFMNRLYLNFATHDTSSYDNINLDLIHIGNLSSLTAIHHFMNYSKIRNKYNIINWNWKTIQKPYYDKSTSHAMLNKEYKQNIIKIFDLPISHQDNILFILNNNDKINFIVSTNNTIDELISVAILSLKILNNNGLVYYKLPDITKWSLLEFNTLLLFSLIFQELYVFHFDMIEKTTILICTNKKRTLSKDLLIRKLISIPRINNLPIQTLFTQDYLHKELPDFIKLYKSIILNKDSKKIIFSDILYEIEQVLELNEELILA